MTRRPVVIRYGSAYPDAVIERLEHEVDQSGLDARLEPLDPDGGSPDMDRLEDADETAGLIAVELPDGATGILLTEPMRITLDTLVDAAQRRRRRQQASGEARDVAVVLCLPGDVQIVVTAEADAESTPLLLTLLAEQAAAPTLAAGSWRWDATLRSLVPSRLDQAE